MKKYVISAIISFFFAAQSHAQIASGEVVTGIVKVEDGRNAGGVAVYLKGTHYGTYSDAAGNFRFEAPAGRYTMVVQSPGVQAKEIAVEVKAGLINSFYGIVVQETPVLIGTSVITGQFTPQSLTNSMYRVKVIDGEKIGRKAATDIQTLLNTEAGIRLSNDMMLGETDFEIMGMGGNNVKVLVDGVPMVERGSNKQSMSQTDINSIDRIEIVEGPMSVVYGTDALAGVVNIITKRPSAKPGVTVSGRVHEETMGSEYSPLRGSGIHRENVNLGWMGKTGIYLDGAFTRYTSGGWRGGKAGREKEWQPKGQYMWTGTAGYRRNGFDAWYRLDYLDEKISTPYNASAVVPDEIFDVDYNTGRFTHRLHAGWRVRGGLRFDLVSSYQDYERRTKSVATDISTGEKWLTTGETDQDVSAMRLLFGRLTAAWHISPKVSLQPGLEYQRTEGSGDRITGSRSVTDAAFFVSAEWRPLDWVGVRPGVRAILDSDYDAPAAIPALLTKFNLTPRIDLRLSYAYGFRSPALRELYFSYHNANHNIDGNPNLKAEYSNSFLASLTLRSLSAGDARLTAAATGFYNDFRDRISMVQEVTDPSHYIYLNAKRYKTVGATIEGTLTWKNLHADAVFSLVGRYNEYAGGGRDIPSFRYSPEVSIGAGYGFDKTEINLFYKFTGKRREYYIDTASGEIVLRGMRSFNWMDFTVNRELWRRASLSAGVRNIFNVTTIENDTPGEDPHQGSSGTSFIGYGRSYFISLGFKIITE